MALPKGYTTQSYLFLLATKHFISSCSLNSKWLELLHASGLG